MEDTNKKLSDEANESKRRKEENRKIKLMDIENAKTTESINNFIEKYYYSTNANKKYFDTQYNKIKMKYIMNMEIMQVNINLIHY